MGASKTSTSVTNLYERMSKISTTVKNLYECGAVMKQNILVKLVFEVCHLA